MLYLLLQVYSVFDSDPAYTFVATDIVHFDSLGLLSFPLLVTVSVWT